MTTKLRAIEFKSVINDRGAYDASKQYYRGDLVSDGGGPNDPVYLVLRPAKGITPPNSEYYVVWDATGNITVPAYTLPNATTTEIGGVNSIANIDDPADETGAVLKAKLEEILAALEGAGIMESAA